MKKLTTLAPEVRIVGIDIDRMMLDEARRSGCPYLVRGSADSLPVRDNVVGFAVSTTSLKDWAKRAQGLAEIGRVVQPGGTALVYDFITSGPESNPPHFRQRFGIVSDVLRRAVKLMQPFSLQDARTLAEAIRTSLLQVRLDVEEDMGIVKLTINKMPGKRITGGERAPRSPH